MVMIASRMLRSNVIYEYDFQSNIHYVFEAFSLESLHFNKVCSAFDRTYVKNALIV